MITNPKFKTIDNIEIDPEFIQEEEESIFGEIINYTDIALVLLYFI